jgi:hypothetical protein
MFNISLRKGEQIDFYFDPRKKIGLRRKHHLYQFKTACSLNFYNKINLVQMHDRLFT